MDVWARAGGHTWKVIETHAVARLVTAARDVAGQGDRNLALNLLQGAALALAADRRRWEAWPSASATEPDSSRGSWAFAGIRRIALRVHATL